MPYLRLQSICLTNFKSFGGTTLIGPFNNQLTCIIGPNGNGKSNIIDAFLFVFGFKAAQLRQENVGGLVHKSAALPNCHSCEVVIKFEEVEDRRRNKRAQSKKVKRATKMKKEHEDLTGKAKNQEQSQQPPILQQSQGPNEDNTALLTDSSTERHIISTFTIARRCTVSGSSTYTVNSEKVSPSELKEFMAAKGVSIDRNLFVILQGQVERLCQLDPAQLADHLEELSGSATAKKKINQQLLPTIDGIYLRKEGLTELTKVKRASHNVIMAQAEKCKKRLVLEGQVAQLKHLLTLRQEHQLGQKAQYSQRDLRKQIEQEQQLVKQIEQLRDHRVSLSSNQSVMRQQAQKTNEQYARLCKLVLQKQNAIASIQQRSCFLSTDAAAAKKQIIQLEKSIQEYSQMKNGQLIEHTIHIPEKELRLAPKFKTMRNQLRQIKDKIKDQEQFLREINESSAKKQKCRQQLKKQSINLSLELRKANERKGELQKKITSLQQLNATVRHQMHQSKHNNPTAKNRVVEELLKANRSGNLCPSVKLRTLKQFVIVEEGFEALISAALPQFDFLFTQKVSEAEQIISYLKRVQIGRTTILVQDEFKNRKPPLPLGNFPESKPLFTLLNITQPSLIPIFQFLTCHIVIVKNLTIAMKIAYNSSSNISSQTNKAGSQMDSHNPHSRQSGFPYSVLTERGQIIDPSGCITLFPIKEYMEPIATLESKLASITSQLTGSQQQLKAVEKEHSSLSLRLQQLSRQLGSEEDIEPIPSEVHQKTITQLKNNQRQIQIKWLKHCNELKDSHDNFKLQNNAISHLSHQQLQNHIQANAHTTNKLLDEFQEYTKVSDHNNKIKAAQLLVQQTNCQKQKQLQKVNKLQQRKTNFVQQIQTIKSQLNQSLQQQNSIQGQFNQVKKLLETIDRDAQLSQKKYREMGAQRQMHRFEIQKLQKEISQIHAAIRSIREEQYNAFQNLEEIGKAIGDWMEECQIASVQGESIQYSECLETIYLVPLENISLGIQVYSSKMKDLPAVDPEVFTEAARSKQALEELEQQLVQCQSQLTDIHNQLRSLREDRFKLFMHGFTTISTHLSSIFHFLTGGNAQLSLLDALNPYEGVQVNVRPVHKSWRRVGLLSGGQKTLASMAFIFAMEKVWPCPFYIMDEIDAALDFRNVQTLAEYVQKRSNIQHVVISLRKQMYERAQTIVGIYKVNDISRVIATEMNQLLALAVQEQGNDGKSILNQSQGGKMKINDNNSTNLTQQQHKSNQIVNLVPQKHKSNQIVNLVPQKHKSNHLVPIQQSNQQQIVQLKGQSTKIQHRNGFKNQNKKQMSNKVVQREQGAVRTRQNRR